MTFLRNVYHSVNEKPATLDEMFESAKKMARELKEEDYDLKEAIGVAQLLEVVLPLVYAN